MNERTAKLLREASENAGNEASIRNDYIGRGRNKETWAVVVTSEVQLLADVLQYFQEQISTTEVMTDVEGGRADLLEYNGMPLEEPENFSIDNMGKQVILY